MSMSYCGERFSLELPNDWEFEERETNVALYRIADGKGAVSVSSAAGALIVDKDINDLFSVFCRGTVQPRVVDSIQSDVNVVFGERRDKSKYWGYWVFRREGAVVFVSYNCRNDEFDPQEFSEVEELVRSLRVK